MSFYGVVTDYLLPKPILVSKLDKDKILDYFSNELKLDLTALKNQPYPFHVICDKSQRCEIFKNAHTYTISDDDIQKFIEVCKNNVFPVMDQLVNDGWIGTTGFVGNTGGGGLLFPSPGDILVAGKIDFRSADVDYAKLRQFFTKYIGAHHASGTCKMGVCTDSKAVVDQQCKVYGTHGLRVCDSSIYPISISWPAATTMVVAEKVAADILRDYN